MTQPTNKPPRPSAKTDTPPKDTSLVARARNAANDAGEQFSDGVDANPLAVIAGGIAVGLVAGALLPKTRLEGEYLGPLGAKLNEGARTAAAAAAEAGKAELAAAGLSRVGANEQVGKVLEGLGSAVRSASTAVRDTRRRPAGDSKG